MVQTAVRTTSNPRSKTFHHIRIESARLDRKVNANTKSGARRKYGKDYRWIFGRIWHPFAAAKELEISDDSGCTLKVKLLEKTCPNDLALTCFRKAVRMKSAESIRSVISISRNVTNFRQYPKKPLELEEIRQKVCKPILLDKPFVAATSLAVLSQAVIKVQCCRR